MSKKIFISHPMRGKSDEQIKEERRLCDQKLSKVFDDYEVMDTFFEKAPVDAKPLWFLGKSLEYLADADYVVFMPGWEDARGCVIEHMCAVAYDIPIYEIAWD